MTLVATQTGLYFPLSPGLNPSNQTIATMDAAAEKVAMIGRLYIAGRPGGTKTLSTGTISFSAGTTTFAAAAGGTTLDVGIQDVATGAGLIAQPDGTFDVKKTLVSATNTITTGAWNTVTMATGSKSMAHGDLIAVVWDMTARTAPDSVIVNTQRNANEAGFGSAIPTTNVNLAGAWQTTQTAGSARLPNVVIAFDDGTLGWIDGVVSCFVTTTVESFQDSTNPDERGLLFQVPWTCKIDAVWALVGATDAASDFTIKLYDAPTTAINNLYSQAVLAENLGLAAGNGLVEIPLATEISLTRNVDYALTILATGTTNTLLKAFTLGDAAHRAQIPGGTTLAKVTRNNSSGNLASASTVIIYSMGVRISQFDDGTGTGGGGNTVFGGYGGVII